MYGFMEFGKFFKIKEVMERTGLARSTIWRLENECKFPQHVKIGKSARWRESDLDAWEADLVQKRGKAA
jgi:prophage regulatory protein